MTGFIIFIHTIICILLMIAILMQAGRGGGLAESFASAESLFGAQTNTFLVKTSTILASIFLVTCLSLAFLSSRKEHSLMNDSLLKNQMTAPRLDTMMPLGAPKTETAPAVAPAPAEDSAVEVPKAESPMDASTAPAPIAP